MRDGRVRWSGGPIGGLAPWRGGAEAAVAWLGPAGAEHGAAPNATDIGDAAGVSAPRRPAFLARRLVMRACVARWTGVPVAGVEVACDAFRRPTLRRPAGGFAVSAASRAGVVGIGLAHRPVGFDLEVPAGIADPPAAVLSAEERERIAALPRQEREAAFLTLWTAKEAYLKAIGLGLARDPAEIAVACGADGALAIRDRNRPVPLLAAQTRARRIGTSPVRAACIVL